MERYLFLVLPKVTTRVLHQVEDHDVVLSPLEFVGSPAFDGPPFSLRQCFRLLGMCCVRAHHSHRGARVLSVTVVDGLDQVEPERVGPRLAASTQSLFGVRRSVHEDNIGRTDTVVVAAPGTFEWAVVAELVHDAGDDGWVSILRAQSHASRITFSGGSIRDSAAQNFLPTTRERSVLVMVRAK